MQKLNEFLESTIWRSCLNAFCLMLILGACGPVVALPLHEAGRHDLLGKDAVVELWKHCESFEEADEFYQKKIQKDLSDFIKGLSFS